MSLKLTCTAKTTITHNENYKLHIKMHDCFNYETISTNLSRFSYQQLRDVLLIWWHERCVLFVLIFRRGGGASVLYVVAMPWCLLIECPALCSNRLWATQYYRLVSYQPASFVYICCVCMSDWSSFIVVVGAFSCQWYFFPSFFCCGRYRYWYPICVFFVVCIQEKWSNYTNQRIWLSTLYWPYPLPTLNALAQQIWVVNPYWFIEYHWMSLPRFFFESRRRK